MKKFYLSLFISVIVQLCFPIISNAQLNVVVDRSEEHCLLVCNKFSNYILSLKERNGFYYITCAQTTKRFDDRYNGITLGVDRKGCLATIDDLLSLAESGNEVVVEDKYFDHVTIWGIPAACGKFLGVRSSGNAGYSIYYPQNLRMIREYIDTHVADIE